MPSQLEELVTFLHSPQPAIVQIALGNLVGYSQGPSREAFFYGNFEAIKDLKKIASGKNDLMVNQAATILVNLCENLKVRNLIVEDKPFLQNIVSTICKVGNPNADLMTILLTNLAKSDSIIDVFGLKVEHDAENEKVFKSTHAMDCLMDCFVKGHDRTLNKYAEYDYLSYFFADISRLIQGRTYFVTEQAYDNVIPLSKILVFTEKYNSKIRREGVASTLKNSLFDTKAHMDLLDENSINLLPYLLLPIAGPEELDEDEMFKLPEELQLLPNDKKREPVSGIICTHLESILLLCSTREVREYLRQKSVYPIIRELHKAVDDEDVQALCDRIVQMLMRDEEPEITGIKEDSREDHQNDDTKDISSDNEDEIVEVV